MSAQIKTYMPDQLVSRISGPVVLLTDHLAAMAAASAYDEEKERALFEASGLLHGSAVFHDGSYQYRITDDDGDEYFTAGVGIAQKAWEGWKSCAKARAKAGGQ